MFPDILYFVQKDLEKGNFEASKDLSAILLPYFFPNIHRQVPDTVHYFLKVSTSLVVEPSTVVAN